VVCASCAEVAPIGPAGRTNETDRRVRVMSDGGMTTLRPMDASRTVSFVREAPSRGLPVGQWTDLALRVRSWFG
jgi:hypothetical protein